MTENPWTSHLSPCTPTPLSWGYQTPHLCAGRTSSWISTCVQISGSFSCFQKKCVVPLNRVAAPCSWCLSGFVIMWPKVCQSREPQAAAEHLGISTLNSSLLLTCGNVRSSLSYGRSSPLRGLTAEMLAAIGRGRASLRRRGISHRPAEGRQTTYDSSQWSVTVK